jgi:sialate O-acetylesterase
MVVTIDLEHPDIHPPNKLDVGNRLANWALARVYGQSIATSGPMFFRAAVRDRQLVVTFDHAGSGLMIANKFGLQPPAEDKTGALNNFEITTDGVTWHVADAAIVGQSVVVSSENVGQPIAVRYAYSSAPANCNLFNRDGLPASPFCSRPELLQCDPGLPE